ncbi:MAG: cytochrome c family protein [Alphaproteobacteria bacterium]|jgi:cytochrome c|nr:cytochrome c family protein [Alphaproteobacteria bacterium]MDP7222237.1 cytochrome c family protein [Alphaproteobacteria bacterium]
MNNMEFNKIFAAILVAGIIASLSGFVSDKLVHPHKLEKDAVTIEGSESTGGSAPAKPQKAEPITALLAAADTARGEKLSKACAACHNFTKGGPNGVGPNLWDIVNRGRGEHAGFSYSDAMTLAEGKWTYEHLNQFLWKPKKVIAGTKMNYIGMKKPEDRAAIIAWLRTLSDSPAPLPSPEPASE